MVMKKNMFMLASFIVVRNVIVQDYLINLIIRYLTI